MAEKLTKLWVYRKALVSNQAKLKALRFMYFKIGIVNKWEVRMFLRECRHNRGKIRALTSREPKPLARYKQI